MHACAIPAQVTDDDGTVHSTRVISEFYTADMHHDSLAAVRDRLGDPEIDVIMIKLWSDGTPLGGNDRLPVRAIRISIANQPLSFSKTDDGQALIGLQTDCVRATCEFALSIYDPTAL